MEPEWQMLFLGWCEEHDLDDYAVDRVKAHENYGIAHTEWAEGAGDATVEGLLDQAAAEIGLA